MFYSMDSDLLYCYYSQQLMQELQLEHISEQWRLFTDSSKVSLKAALLHNSIPLVHMVHMKEMYESLHVLLQKIRHKEHRMNICGDLKLAHCWDARWIHYILLLLTFRRRNFLLNFSTPCI
jgi:hypothetical protein